MINRNDFSQKRQGLKADMLGKATRAILTVDKVEEVDVADKYTGEKRKSLAITFHEFPENAYWPNNTSINVLCDMLGENEKNWIGKKIPIQKVKTTNPNTKTVGDALWVAKADEWDEFNLGNGKKVAAKITAKKGGKK